MAANPPRFSFSGLYRLLRNASAPLDEVKQILEEHKDSLFDAVSVKHDAAKLNTATSTDIKYRPGAYGTQSHPKPTSAELQCIEAVEKGLGISRVDTALLVRDFLIEEEGKNLSDTLDQSTDFIHIAPINALESFLRKEKRCAFSCLVVICAGASQNSTHAYYHAFVAFLDTHGAKLKQIILHATSAALAMYNQRGARHEASYFGVVQEWWVMEALFAYCLHDTLTPREKEKLMSDYNKIAKEASAVSVMDTGGSDLPPTFLDGGEATAFFTASLNLPHGLARAVHTDHDTMALETEENESGDEAPALATDEQTIGRIDAILVDMRKHETAESALMSFSWAAFLRLRRTLANMDVEDDGYGENDFNSVAHMFYAINNGVFAVIRGLAFTDLVVNEVIAGELYQCFWVDLVAFLIAFPPQNFTPEQVEGILELSVALLNKLDRDILREIAESLWEVENTEADIAGPNSLLRLASGVYPSTFRPLVTLLTCLTTSQNSAARAADYLQGRLLALTEQSEGYQESVIVLDPDDDADILESLSSRLGPRFDRALRNLQSVSPGDEEIVYVQAGTDLPGESYRRRIPKGSLGISNSALSTVTWVVSWDGFGALDHMMITFLQLLREHETFPGYGDGVLEELILSSLDTLRFIDRLCRIGSKSLREMLSESNDRISIVTGIFVELADPGDWAIDSWLTKKRRETLLTAAASCISSMSIGSPTLARRTLDLISSAKSILPIQTALSTLGANAFPAVAAVSHIANMCSHSEHLSDGFLRKLSSLVRSDSTVTALQAFDGYRAGANRVYEFLRSIALPVWLTSSVMDNENAETRSLFWLLPACSLELFSKRPSDVLNDSAVSSVLVSAITTVGGSVNDSSNDGFVGRTFLFPAVQAALVACYEALRERNTSLQDATKDQPSSHQTRERKSSKGFGASANLTTLEKLLLKPDVMHAMATIAAGRSEMLDHEKFFSSWAKSEFKSFVPDMESNRYLFLNASGKDLSAEKICSWREWIQDMCARCLALQFCCLSQLSANGSIVQVPWPTVDRSSHGQWRGGGEDIRQGYAKRIQAGSIACIELMVTVFSCGQRAAARSLMGPRPRKVEPVKRVRFANVDEPKKNGDQDGPKDSQSDPSVRASSKDSNEVLTAVIRNLRSSSDLWVSKLGTINKENRFTVLKELGQCALMMATCIRFLRVGWESHSSKWFEDCWKKQNVWELLAGFLRCEPGRGGERMDLSKSLDQDHDYLAIGFKAFLSRMLQTKSVETVLLRQNVSVDIISAWKSIVSDCFRMFSSEILLRASEEVLAPKDSSGASTEQLETKDRKLSEQVFKEEPFVQFSSVFTQHWMHVLLQVDSHYLSGGLQSEKEGASADEYMQLSSRMRDDDNPVSVEQRTKRISILLGEAIGLNENEAANSKILYDFRRAGDIRMRFGSDYAFDVPSILSFMKALDVDLNSHQDLLMDILQLNAELSRKDVQVEVVTAFSSMASAVLFTDSFAPSQAIALTYSSPQFGGKLCRFLSGVLVCIMPAISTSAHTAAILSEVAKLLASLSANLTPDELEQAALTSIRFPQLSRFAQHEYDHAPLGQLCFCLNRILVTVHSQSSSDTRNANLLESARWLLLTASGLVRGSAFRSQFDISELANTAIASMRCEKANPRLLGAASVAVSAVLENVRETSFRHVFDETAIEAIFGAIATLATLKSGDVERNLASESAGNLLLTVARIYLVSADLGIAMPSSLLRHLCGGSILTFLPPASDAIPTYEFDLEGRNPAHNVWVACLNLSSMIIPNGASEHQRAQEKEQETRDVLEFCATNLPRITRDSLDLSGDWPSTNGSDADKHVTIGRVEEAEAACVTLFKLSNYALQLQDGLPELLHAVVLELIKFIYQAYRLIRAEPLERWVRPVTQRERDRSQLIRGEREMVGSNAVVSGNTSPWNNSPVKSTPAGASSPQRRSPSQALRAAIGGSSGRGRLSPGFLPPSPGMPATPLQSPPSGGPGSHNASLSSPASPWGPYGAGLITMEGLKFGEEASRSLLRGLSFALGAIRRFAEELDVVLFKPTMVLSEDTVGIGVLVAIQYHACTEICRGAEDDRRDTLQMIIDNALYLTITHALRYDDEGALPQGVKDELRKRIGTVRTRMRKVVPPVPSFSIVHSKQLELFLMQLKGST